MIQPYSSQIEKALLDNLTFISLLGLTNLCTVPRDPLLFRPINILQIKALLRRFNFIYFTNWHPSQITFLDAINCAEMVASLPQKNDRIDDAYTIPNIKWDDRYQKSSYQVGHRISNIPNGIHSSPMARIDTLITHGRHLTHV